MRIWSHIWYRVHSAGMALLMVILMAGLSSPAQPEREVLVIISSGAAAYAEAAESLQTVLEIAGVRTHTVESAEGAASIAKALAYSPAVVVAIGSTAVDAVRSLGYVGPLVATMVVESTLEHLQESSLSSAIVLDVAPNRALMRLKLLFPDRIRIALVRGPAMSQTKATSIRAEGERLGYQIQILDCPTPKVLLDKLKSLRGKCDFIWCFPDNSLYRGPIVSALILSALRQRLPLIGYSEGMVRAGALVGFFPDYGSIGRQTAEPTLALLGGRQVVRLQDPLQVMEAVNERVMRVLGDSISDVKSNALMVIK